MPRRADRPPAAAPARLDGPEHETEPRLYRFNRTVRWVHWATGALMMGAIGTAAVLFNSSLAVLVGNRYLVEQIHVYCGFALPVPLLVGLLSRAYRADLGRLNRFTPDDWRWLRSSTRRDGTLEIGKFNAGQKLNAALSGGAIAVLLMSGTVMYFTRLTRLTWREGATFVHDWFALAVGLLVAGHAMFALRDTIAMQGMRTGYVPRTWARREHPVWAAELTGEPVPEHGTTSPSPVTGQPPRG